MKLFIELLKEKFCQICIIALKYKYLNALDFFKYFFSNITKTIHQKSNKTIKSNIKLNIYQ